MDIKSFSGATTVDEVIRSNAALARVFAACGIDTCCGGGATLAEAAERRGIALSALLQALGSGESAAGSPGANRPACAAAATQAAAAAAPMQFTRFFIASLVLAITFGATLGALMLGVLTLPSWHFLGTVPLGAAKAAHAYAQVFGFATLFIMGVAYHTMPRFKGTPLANPALAARSFWLQVGGVGLLATGTLIGPPLGVMAWLVGTIGLFCAAVSFFSVVRRTLGASPPLPEGFEPYLQAGCVWLVLASGLSVVSVGAAAGVGVQFLPAVWAAALWGFIGCWIFGMSLRVLPVFLGLPAPRWRPLLFLSYQGAVLLWACNAFLETWVELPWLRSLAGAALLLSVLGFLWRLGLFGPRQNAINPGMRDSERFIYTGYLWLLAAVVLEPGWGAAAAAAGTGVPPSIVDFARHAFTLGFLTQMIVGVASRIVPVITGQPLWSRTCTTLTFLLLNVAVGVRGLQVVVALVGAAAALRPYVSLSGPLGLAAFAAFALNVMMTTRARRMAAGPAASVQIGAVPAWSRSNQYAASGGES